MNTTTMNPETADGQIARLLAANDELKAELEKQYVLTLHLEDDRDTAQSQRDAWREANKLLQTRLTLLHVGIIDTLDRLSNRVQGLPTRDELDDREVRIIRMCKQELSEAERGGAGVVGRGEDSTQAIHSRSASPPASSSATHTAPTEK